MTNLTIAVDEDLLRRARIRALEQGTSVNALLRDYLEAFTGASNARRRAVDRLLALSEAARSGRGDRRWTRDELHER
jgi:plasmid stability protein